MGSGYSIEQKEPFFGPPLEPGTDRSKEKTKDLIHDRALAWKELDRLDGTLLCLCCRKTGHSFKDCQFKGDSSYPPLLQHAADHALLVEFISKEGNGPDEICGRCKTVDLEQILQAKDTKTPSEQSFFLAEVNDLEIFVQCAICRLLFLLLSPLKRKNDLFLDIIVTSPKTRLAGQDMNQKEPDGGPETPILVGSSDGNRGPGAIGVIWEDGELRTAFDAQIVENRLDTFSINRWLDECLGHGEICNNRNGKVLPLRLIDVRSMKVVQTRNLQEPEYFALSYVWGGYRAPAFQQDLEHVPQTIQDAITLVKRLKKSYIWVDALCIDQNNNEEVKNETEIMDGIYSGALCTIVPLQSKGSDDGITLINPNLTVVPQLSARTNGATLVSLFPTLQDISQNESTWSTRGWTFQESLLSRRMLFFTSYQVYFQCSVQECCQTLQAKIPAQTLTSRGDDLSRYLQFFRSTDTLGKPLEEATTSEKIAKMSFQRFLSAYSHLQLTKSSDRIRAFTGILHRLSIYYYKTGFYWGLPISDLRNALLWDIPKRTPTMEKKGGWVTRKNPIMLKKTETGWILNSESPVDRIHENPSWSWGGWLSVIEFPGISTYEDDTTWVYTSQNGGPVPRESTSVDFDLECYKLDRGNFFRTPSQEPAWETSSEKSMDVEEEFRNKFGTSHPDYVKLDPSISREHILLLYGSCISIHAVPNFAAATQAKEKSMEPVVSTERDDTHAPEATPIGIGMKVNDRVLRIYGNYLQDLDLSLFNELELLVLFSTRYTAQSDGTNPAALVYSGILLKDVGGAFERVGRVSLEVLASLEVEDLVKVSTRPVLLV